MTMASSDQRKLVDESPGALPSKQTMDSTKGTPAERQTGQKWQTVKKCAVTCLFSISYLGTGTLTVVIGSALLDIQILTDTTASEIAWVFPFKSIGMLAGSFLAMTLPSRYHTKLILIMALVFGASVVTTAFCTSRFELMAIVFLHGISGMSIWVPGTLINVRIWKKQKAPALYFLSFGLYLGFFIGPALSYNFTSSHYKNQTVGARDENLFIALNQTIFSGHLLNGITLNEHVENRSKSSVSNAPDENPFDKATIRNNLASLFSIVSIGVVVCGPLIYLVCRSLELDRVDTAVDETQVKGNAKKTSSKFGWFLIGIASIVQFVGDGQVVSTVGSYMKSYIMLYMNLSKSQATITATVFTGTYVSWAFFGIFFQRKFGPSISFYLLVQSNLLATITMFLSGQQFVPFTIGCALLGVGLSAKSSALICWVTDAAVGMEKAIIYTTYIAWGLGDMFQATLVGQLFDNHPGSFVYVLLIGSIVFFSSFVIGQTSLVIYKRRMLK